ncbi:MULTISPECIES: LPXTG cell wall anchor domain-containing protein [unclassified Microbacterium]|nr:MULTISPECIES: LPXTG cell wall anchor domain-containing protein [unclassified Microbacterium]MBN9225164.1 LPXTG cell wall anchor domain-containing protein [Microbacterium sp.]
MSAARAVEWHLANTGAQPPFPLIVLGVLTALTGIVLARRRARTDS